MNPSSNTLHHDRDQEELTKLENSLPRELWFDGTPMCFYQGFWAHKLKRILSFQNHFQARDTDIFATSFRKVGTTWLKALLFAICDRSNHPCSSSPLLNHNSHELVPHLESTIYRYSECPDLTSLKSPRFFGTHVPISSLPSSIMDSKCKIIYIARNPFDAFVSSWLFYQTIDNHKALLQPDKLNHYFDMFCEGKVPYGPFPDHVLGYWKASLESPEKVLFVKYEDLKADPKPQLKTIAEFVGCPFTSEEEVGGVIDDIVELCNIKNLKDVAESNKSGRAFPHIGNDTFYRKGEVGDWINHMTPSMADRLRMITEEKFRGSGLTFRYE